MTERKRRILIVDDEASLTRLLKAAVENAGPYEVLTANTAADGLRIAGDSRPDLILLDMIMPDRSGRDLAKDLGASETLKSVPIVFLTASIPRDPTVIQQGLIDGHPVIAKPVSVDELLRRLEEPLRVGPPNPS